MFLHLGGTVHVPSDHIVCVLDIENNMTEALQGFMEHNKKNTVRVNLQKRKGRARAMVVTRQQIYLSPISAFTLQKRLKKPADE